MIMNHERGPSLPEEDPAVENQNQQNISDAQDAEVTNPASHELPEVTEQAIDDTYGLNDGAGTADGGSPQTDPAARRRSLIRRGLATIALGAAVTTGVLFGINRGGDQEAHDHVPDAPSTSAPAYGYGNETMDKNNAEQTPAEATADKLAGDMLKTLRSDKHASIITVPDKISGGANITTYSNESSIKEGHTQSPNTQISFNAKTHVVSLYMYRDGKKVEVMYHATRHNAAANASEGHQLTAAEFGTILEGEKDLTSMSATDTSKGQDGIVMMSMKRGPNMEKLPQIIDAQGLHTDPDSINAAMQRMQAMAGELQQ